MSSRHRLTVSLVLLLACGPTLSSSETGTSSSTTDDITTTTTATPTTGTSTTTSAGATACDDGCGTSETSSGFISPSDYGEGYIECDVFAQDCRAGQKCTAWADGGQSWNATKCVSITGSKLPGEPCTAEDGGLSGLDDCAFGAICWDVDDEGHGTCVAQCIGSELSPKCSDPNSSCITCGDCVLHLCLPLCDPLAQDCTNDRLCIPANQTYLCVVRHEAEPAAVFEACEFANACDKGLVCLSPVSASECDQGEVGCCLPMCSIPEGGAACPGKDQQCSPMYEPQLAGFEDVGYCSLMP